MRGEIQLRIAPPRPRPASQSRVALCQHDSLLLWLCRFLSHYLLTGMQNFRQNTTLIFKEALTVVLHVRSIENSANQRI